MQNIQRGLKNTLRKIVSNRWLFRSIGIVVFILILTRIDLRATLTAITTVDPVFLMLSIVFQAIALVVTTYRWQLIMRKMEIDLPFRRSFTLQLIGTAAAVVTPGQIGEFVKVAYHRSYGFPVPESFLSVAMDRAFDLFALLFFGIVSLAILFGLPPAWSAIIICICAAVIVGGGLFVRHQEKFSNWLARVLARISPPSYKDAVQTSTERLVERVGSFSIEFLVLSWPADCSLLRIAAATYLLHSFVLTHPGAILVPGHGGALATPGWTDSAVSFGNWHSGHYCHLSVGASGCAQGICPGPVDPQPDHPSASSVGRVVGMVASSPPNQTPGSRLVRTGPDREGTRVCQRKTYDLTGCDLSITSQNRISRPPFFLSTLFCKDCTRGG